MMEHWGTFQNIDQNCLTRFVSVYNTELHWVCEVLLTSLHHKEIPLHLLPHASFRQSLRRFQKQIAEYEHFLESANSKLS